MTLDSGREQRIKRHGKSCRVAPNVHANADGYLRVSYKGKWLKGLSWTLGHAQGKLALAKANHIKSTYPTLQTEADARQIIATRIETERHEKRMADIKEAHRTALDASYYEANHLEEVARMQDIKAWEI